MSGTEIKLQRTWELNYASDYLAAGTAFRGKL